METVSERIRQYQPTCQQEEQDQIAILQYLSLGANVLERESLLGHFTSSALIVNPSRTKTLFIHHKIYQKWAWTGGHMDGETDFLHVALKEAQEETGVRQLKVLSPEIASLDIIPVNGHVKNGSWVSAHLHFSVAFLLEAEETEALIVNEAETNGVAWLPIDEIEAYSQEPHVFPVYQKMLAALAKLA